MENKYANAKIYRIVLPDERGTYVGSTCQRLLCMRLRGYVKDSKQLRNVQIPSYKAINELPERWEGIKIELLEDFPCQTKDQLNKPEGEIIRQMGTLNKRIEGRTWQICQFGHDCKDDRDEYLAYQRKYQTALE